MRPLRVSGSVLGHTTVAVVVVIVIETVNSLCKVVDYDNDKNPRASDHLLVACSFLLPRVL